MQSQGLLGRGGRTQGLGGGERRRCDGGSRGQGVPEKGLPAKECEQVLEKGKGLSQSGLL